jgi:hypothetical protein
MAKQIIHVGYSLIIGEKEKELLKPHLGDLVEKLRKDIYTAALFRKPMMDSWYNARETKQIMGYVRSLYIDQKKGVVVAVITIEAIRYYITLVHSKTDIPLQSLKLMANAGKLGPEIKVERVDIPCKVYKFEDDKK